MGTQEKMKGRNIAMYASDMLFVENDFGRYGIGSTTDRLKKNSD
jgi:hypothetical protein